jgi:glutamyl-tRNA reductase
MPTVVVESELFERIEQAAREQQSSASDIFTEAARRYLWELDRRKISEESRIYRQRHTELRDQYLGQYIAMHEGQVVDQDPDLGALRHRVRQKFGRTPIMMTRVEDTAEQPLIRHGFQMEATG